MKKKDENLPAELATILGRLCGEVCADLLNFLGMNPRNMEDEIEMLRRLN